MWKPLPYKPTYAEFHPCIHRWMQQNIPKLPPKHVRYIVKQTTLRTEFLAIPLLRRLLSLYTYYADALPEDKKARILKILLDNGFTEKKLNRMIKEERKRKAILKKKIKMSMKAKHHGEDDDDEDEEDDDDVEDDDDDDDDDDDEEGGTGKKKKKGKGKKGKGKKGKGKKGKGKKGKRKGKKGKGKKGKGKGKKGKGGKGKGKGEGKGKGKGKKGKDKHESEDEGYKPGKPGQLPPGWPHSIGLQIMQLNWQIEETPPDEIFISRAQAYFSIQARAIEAIVSKDKELDVKGVNKYLNLIVWIAQAVCAPAQAIPDEDVETLLKLRGGELITKKKKKKVPTESEAEEKQEVVAEGPQSLVRRWTVQNYPRINPQKKRLRTSDIAQLLIAPAQVSLNTFLANEAAGINEPEEEEETPDVTKLSFPLTIDDEQAFLNSSKWYNPLSPEFIYDGPHKRPINITFVNRKFEDLKWILNNANMQPQDAHPHSVPLFYPELRPIIHSGGSKPNLTENGCWYIMNVLDYYNIKKPKKMNFAAIHEQLEMIFRLIKTMTHVPKLGANRVVELVAELCESITLSDIEEYVTPAQKLMDDKRTIILERIFLKFFSSKFRDFNKKTAGYMRIICQRGAILIRHLYEYTALELWRIQHDEEIEIVDEPEEKIDDPEDILKWGKWLQFLSESSRIAISWQQWLQNEIERNEFPENREVLIEEAKDWLLKGQIISSESQEYAEIAKLLKPIYHQPILQAEDNLEDPLLENEDDWSEEDMDAQ